MAITSSTGTRASRQRLRATVSVVRRPEPYRNLLYLGTALPLGLVYVVSLVTGFTLGIVLSVVLVGVLVVIGVIAWSRVLQGFERRLANRWLDTAIAEPSRLRPETGLLARGKAALSDRATWMGLLFLLLKLPMGVLSFGLLVTTATLTLGLVTMPLYYHLTWIDVTLLWWEIETLAEALVCVPLGMAVGIASLHVTNLAARASGYVAQVFL